MLKKPKMSRKRPKNTSFMDISQGSENLDEVIPDLGSVIVGLCNYCRNGVKQNQAVVECQNEFCYEVMHYTCSQENSCDCNDD